MATPGTRRRDLLHPQRMAALAAAALPRLPSEIEAVPDGLIRAGRQAMACLFEILLSTRDRSRIMTVHRALDLIQELEGQMTVFRDDSEICRLNRRAFAVLHRQQVDERTAAAGVDEDDYSRIGYVVTVEVAKSDQVAYNSGLLPLRRTGAVLYRSPAPVESNRRLLVAEQRQVVLGAMELFARQTPQLATGGGRGFLLGASRLSGHDQADRQKQWHKSGLHLTAPAAWSRGSPHGR